MSIKIFDHELDNDFSLSFDYDHTGMSAYTNEQKKNIIEDVLKNIATKGVYLLSSKPVDQKLNYISEDALLFDGNKIDKFDVKCLKALLYNLYVFGTFKWGRFIMISHENIKLPSTEEGKENIINFWVFIDTHSSGYNSGIIQASLSEKITDFVEKNLNKVKNNLEKLLDKHGYELEVPDQRKFLFGKGHLNLKKDKKIKCRSDLNIIFTFMNNSKELIREENKFEPMKFPLKSLQFFKLREKLKE